MEEIKSIFTGVTSEGKGERDEGLPRLKRRVRVHLLQEFKF